MGQLDGLLLINKPAGITSHDVVAKVRKKLKRKDIGHAGTLDPIATGLIILLLGEATKISEYVLTGDKGYRLKAQFGFTTDMWDVTGKTLESTDFRPRIEDVRSVASQMIGDFLWPVPVYSAVKVDGRKLYELARQGVAVESPQKNMRFWGVEVEHVTSEEIIATIYCSKGSFIRTWVYEMGRKLGCGATLTGLERLYSAPFSLSQAVSLADLEAASDHELEAILRQPSFVPLRETLLNWEALTVNGKDQKLLYNGQISYDLERRLIPLVRECIATNKTLGVRVLSGENGQLLSLIEAQPGRGLKIRRVFR